MFFVQLPFIESPSTDPNVLWFCFNCSKRRNTFREIFFKIGKSRRNVKLLVTGYVINYLTADWHMPNRKEGKWPWDQVNFLNQVNLWTVFLKNLAKISADFSFSKNSFTQYTNNDVLLAILLAFGTFLAGSSSNTELAINWFNCFSSTWYTNKIKVKHYKHCFETFMSYIHLWQTVLISMNIVS